MDVRNGVIFISFDAVAFSGITVEAFKTAQELVHKGIKPYLDLGYDIKIDKGKFNKPYEWENAIYKGGFTLVRINDITSLPDYNPGFIEYSHNVLISQKITASSAERERILSVIDKTACQLAKKIVLQWEQLNIGTVYVENGTLPENIIYTKALYIAIDVYGKRYDLEKFVTWRDHDLMWNSEKTVMKYGAYPYPYAIKPIKSPYITYVTLNEDLKAKLEEWCNYAVEVKVKKNAYNFSEARSHSDMRRSLGIGCNDILIARTTRLIPQKRLDRDIYLVSKLNQLFQQHGREGHVFLVIAGDPHEAPECYQSLVDLARTLQVEPFIHFIGWLQHGYMPPGMNTYTIEDLYYSCDVVSFLTSWDYDSYGNPIGEAISHRRCYISTRYEYYDEVYGQYGFFAPVMDISAEKDDLPDDEFILNVYKLITNKPLMSEMAYQNFLIGKKILNSKSIES
ncbi:glycosyl transferase family 2 [Kosakonia sp.]|uniref:glycosyl transferase family 2 n=1 Tax=Kosakonia sp. TaxID=1916651 RepID=UPI0028A61159|nr:glycosyl transferase family 2 [Kosakonia sp.]